ncbi:MAG: hypothetical protein M1837_001432 [Sclerophora amabilis]|nr:MAG: hypothetical protein M1837_001432 [Sclerophora amabilis]
MGSWARRTRLRWRWSQFRFETLFTVPEIVLASYLPVDNAEKRRVQRVTNGSIDEWITGSQRSRERTMDDTVTSADDRDSERVCWLPFLTSLHQDQATLGKFFFDFTRAQGAVARDNNDMVGPAVRFRERSWDLMPLDVVHPLAVTNISDIAVMARGL